MIHEILGQNVGYSGNWPAFVEAYQTTYEGLKAAGMPDEIGAVDDQVAEFFRKYPHSGQRLLTFCGGADLGYPRLLAVTQAERIATRFPKTAARLVTHALGGQHTLARSKAAARVEQLLRIDGDSFFEALGYAATDEIRRVLQSVRRLSEDQTFELGVARIENLGANRSGESAVAPASVDLP